MRAPRHSRSRRPVSTAASRRPTSCSRSATAACSSGRGADSPSCWTAGTSTGFRGSTPFRPRTSCPLPPASLGRHVGQSGHAADDGGGYIGRCPGSRHTGRGCHTQGKRSGGRRRRGAKYRRCSGPSPGTRAYSRSRRRRQPSPELRRLKAGRRDHSARRLRARARHRDSASRTRCASTRSGRDTIRCGRYGPVSCRADHVTFQQRLQSHTGPTLRQ